MGVRPVDKPREDGGTWRGGERVQRGEERQTDREREKKRAGDGGEQKKGGGPIKEPFLNVPTSLFFLEKQAQAMSSQHHRVM